MKRVTCINGRAVSGWKSGDMGAPSGGASVVVS